MIRRSSRIPNSHPGISRFSHGVTTSQLRIEKLLLASIRKNPAVEIKRHLIPTEMTYDPALGKENDTYPITVRLKPTEDPESSFARGSHRSQSAHEGSNGQHDRRMENGDVSSCDLPKMEKAPHIIRCKYLVGCDGAHSWTRKQLGITMEGDQMDYTWAVMGEFVASASIYDQPQSVSKSQKSLVRLY